MVQRLEKVTGKNIPFVEGDVRDTKLLEKTLKEFKVDAVIHFAGLKAVTESVKNPIEYYANNVQGSISLLHAIESCNIKIIVFSSSATVYGKPQYLPYDEEHPTNPINPYGGTNLQVEQMLKDLSESDSRWMVAILRYFNPVGAHESGLIGEDPKGTPNNLMPTLNKIASGELPYLEIFGDDYPTNDGTAERDYIHVVDLVDGHQAALNYINNHPGLHVFNLGTGESNSVLNLVSQYELATGKILRKKTTARREGDLPSYYANANKAKALLLWEAQKTLDDMCLTVWNYYRDAEILK